MKNSALIVKCDRGKSTLNIAFFLYNFKIKIKTTKINSFLSFQFSIFHFQFPINSVENSIICFLNLISVYNDKLESN